MLYGGLLCFIDINIFVLLLIILIVASCKKVGPIETNGNNRPQSYYLYAGGRSGDKIYVIDTDSNVVVDSLVGFMKEIWSFVVTKSGRKMYVASLAPNDIGSLYSVDLKTHDVCQIHNQVADLYVAPDGTVFVITLPYRQGNPPRAIGIVDTLTDVVFIFDTLDIRLKYYGYAYQNVIFDEARNLLYAVNNDTIQRLFAYDYVQKKVVRVYQSVNAFYFLHMMISPNGRYLYVAGGPILDLERDSVVGGVGGNYLGSLALSPDGNYLYKTDPGKYMILEPLPSGKMRIYDTRLRSDVGEIFFCYACITDRLVLLPPHHNIVYVSGWMDVIFVVDLQINQKIDDIFTQAFTVPLVMGRKQ